MPTIHSLPPGPATHSFISTCTHHISIPSHPRPPHSSLPPEPATHSFVYSHQRPPHIQSTPRVPTFIQSHLHPPHIHSFPTTPATHSFIPTSTHHTFIPSHPCLPPIHSSHHTHHTFIHSFPLAPTIHSQPRPPHIHSPYPPPPLPRTPREGCTLRECGHGVPRSPTLCGEKSSGSQSKGCDPSPAQWRHLRNFWKVTALESSPFLPL